MSLRRFYEHGRNAPYWHSHGTRLTVALTFGLNLDSAPLRLSEAADRHRGDDDGASEDISTGEVCSDSLSSFGAIDSSLRTARVGSWRPASVRIAEKRDCVSQL
jgi:hypothetical protein